MAIRECFDADAYNRALNFLGRHGLIYGVDTSQERTDLAGKYGCDDSHKGFLVDLPESRYLSIEVSGSHDLSGYPNGVQTLLGYSKSSDISSSPYVNRFYAFLADAYNCELNSSQDPEADKYFCRREAMVNYKLASVSRANAIEKKAKRLIELAGEQDSGPFGIEADELLKVFQSRRLHVPSWIRDVIKVESYIASEKEQEDVFTKMLETYSGRETVRERGVDLGCAFEEWSAGYRVTCYDIGTSVFIGK